MYIVIPLLLISIETFADEKKNNDEKKVRSFMALPAAGYTTDTGFIGGAALLKSYHRDRKRLSTVKLFTIYTEKKQLSSTFEVDHYFEGDRDRVLLQLVYQKYPSTFYGFGNNTDNDTSEKYTPEFFETGVFL